MLVGGTGLYIRTLLEGIAPIPEIDAAVREEVRALPTPEAYAALQAEDAERAAALSLNDSQRIARALEVVRSTGHPLAYWQERREGGIGDAVALAPLVLLPEREAVWKYQSSLDSIADDYRNVPTVVRDKSCASPDARFPRFRSMRLWLSGSSSPEQRPRPLGSKGDQAPS